MVQRCEIYSFQIFLSRSKAGPGRTVKQEQEEISPNHLFTMSEKASCANGCNSNMQNPMRASTNPDVHISTDPRMRNVFLSCILHSISHGGESQHLQLPYVGEAAISVQWSDNSFSLYVQSPKIWLVRGLVKFRLALA